MMAVRNQEPQNPHQKVWLEQALAQGKEGEMLVGHNSLRSLVRGQIQAAKLLGRLGLGLLCIAPPTSFALGFFYFLMDLLPFQSRHSHTSIIDS